MWIRQLFRTQTDGDFVVVYSNVIDKRYQREKSFPIFKEDDIFHANVPTRLAEFSSVLSNKLKSDSSGGQRNIKGEKEILHWNMIGLWCRPSFVLFMNHPKILLSLLFLLKENMKLVKMNIVETKFFKRSVLVIFVTKVALIKWGIYDIKILTEHSYCSASL